MQNDEKHDKPKSLENDGTMRKTIFDKSSLKISIYYGFDDAFRILVAQFIRKYYDPFVDLVYDTHAETHKLAVV
jgi:hypothetical protein